MAGPAECPVIGSCVSLDRKLAFVRYFGDVDGQDGQWVGLEWEDEARGKHNGTHAGRQYFYCSEGKLSGTFLRWEKFCQLLDPLTSIVDALKTRYQDHAACVNTEDDADMFVTTSSHKKVPVELVLDGKGKPLASLTQVVLSGMNIATVGEAGQLAEMVPLLTDLDLSCNLFTSWNALGPLAAELPNLESLNLSSNILQMPAPGGKGNLQPFRSLHTLVLNRCGVTFQQALLIQPALPSLRTLHLQGNAISSLEEPGTAFNGLEVLDLEENKLCEWREVERLAALPSLRHLHLSGNALTTISYPAGSEGSPAFPALETLLLGHNEITSWNAVDQLDLFPALRDVRLTGNPVLRTEAGGGRFQVIARVGRLTMLNASEVRPQERRDAELRYLRIVQGQMQSGSVTEADIAAAHPRLATLMQRYGDTGAASTGPSTGTSLAAGLLELRLTCLAASTGKRMGTQTKKLPGTLTLGNLKVLCERLFKLPVARQVLFMRSSSDPLPQSLADDDLRDLAYLGVQAGAEILVDEVDLEARRAAAEEAAAREQADHDQRIAQQLRDVQRLMDAEKDMQRSVPANPSASTCLVTQTAI